MLIDSYADLSMLQFDCDRAEVIALATQAGFPLTVRPDVNSSRQPVAISSAFSPVYAVAGIHPYKTKNTDKESLEAL